MNRILRNDKGATLVLILAVMSVLAIIGTTLLQAGLAENRFAIREENRLKAYYIARSGAEAVSAWIEVPPTEPTIDHLAIINTLITENTANADTWSTFSEGRFKIHFSGDQFHPIIHSVGEINGVEQQVNLSLAKEYYFDAAVTVLERLEMQNLNNTNIYGDVAYKPGAVITGNGSGNISGGSYISHRTYYSPVDPTLDVLAVPFTWPADRKISSTSSFANHNLGSVTFDNNTYTIELNGDMSLQFTDLTMNSNTDIYVTGTGILKMYANHVDFKGRLHTESTAKTILNIFDSGTFDMQTGNGKFEGFINGPGAEMEIKANFDSVGAIIAKKITLQSGGNITFSSTVGNVYPEDLGYPSLGYSKNMWMD